MPLPIGTSGRPLTPPSPVTPLFFPGTKVPTEQGKPWDLTSHCKEPTEWNDTIGGVSEMPSQLKPIPLPSHFLPIAGERRPGGLEELPALSPHFLHHFYPFSDLSQLCFNRMNPAPL